MSEGLSHLGYLDYPMRRKGLMDHDFYPWRDTWSAPRLEFENGAKLGVWLQLAVEWFPLNISGKPFLPVGAPNRPWPDSETYTQRDYGLRVGIYRMLDALKARGLPINAFLNARVAERYPMLMQALIADGAGFVAAGLDAGAIHHEGLSEAEERAMIRRVREIFAGFGVTPDVWHSPSWSQSTRTPRLLLEEGFTAMADWCNDEAPYAFDTGAGVIASLPGNLDLCDRDMIGTHFARQSEYAGSILAAACRLLREAEESGSGRLLTLNMSPWLMGQPFRMAMFEEVLDGLQDLGAVTFVSTDALRAASRDLI